jgi:hypothetical protein
MRFVAIGCALLVAGTAITAARAGGSCGFDLIGSDGTLVFGYGDAPSDAPPIPIDGTPWIGTGYWQGGEEDCVLVQGTEVVPVVRTMTGGEDCDDLVFPGIRSYVPAVPLTRGQEYALVCDGEGTDPAVTGR